MPQPFTMNSFRGKQVLALVRDGDFAHAGEAEAIEMTLAKTPKDPARHLLDAGCGRGGTAAYMQAKGWGRVTGFDIDGDSVEGARAAYPDVTFFACDLLRLPERLGPDFALITLFNVLYAIPDQATALGALAAAAAPGAELLLFDYTLPEGAPDRQGESIRPFMPAPLKPDSLPGLLAGAGWALQDFEDITAAYIRWYQDLVAKIAAKRSAIEALAGPEGYDHVLGRYSDLLARHEDGRLGGAIVRARRADT